MDLQDLLNQSAAISSLADAGQAQQQTSLLQATLSDALLESEILQHFKRQYGRDECAVEDNNLPFIQVSFDVPFGEKYSTEAVFTLREGKFCCYVRTWYFPERYDLAAGNYELAKNGDLDDDVFGDDFDDLAKAVAQKVVDHREALLKDLGVSLSVTTRKAIKPENLSDILV